MELSAAQHHRLTGATARLTSAFCHLYARSAEITADSDKESTNELPSFLRWTGGVVAYACMRALISLFRHSCVEWRRNGMA